ncbi:MAG: PAS domain S-box protein [Desmonostoc vinosum HA7617-LM4]|jgi:PAS domain S-box-containing protein|nr:PAS domain S-box protein [Desmonostoc vinosum HA7617-LM4]
MANQRQEQKRLLQQMFERACDAIAVTDERGFFVEVNAAACKLFGLSQKALLKRNLADLTDAELDFQQICLSIQNGSQPTGELYLLRPDGSRREVEYTLSLNVAPHRHLVILRDITERQEAAKDELWCQRQWVELFSEVTLKIRQSLQLKEILRATVTEVQRILQADRVLIYQVLPDGTGKAISEAVLPEYPAILELEFPEEVFPQEYQKLYAAGRVRAIADVHDSNANLADCLVEFIDQFDIKAKLIVPILQNLNSHQQNESQTQNKLWGLLIAHHCHHPRRWVDFELELMQQLADQISIALAQAQLLEHLEEMVEVRTAELKDANRNLHQEINDRMQAEEALRRSEEQLRLITNALPVLIAYVDNQQRYSFNNKAYEDWLGQSPLEIHGCHLQDVWGQDCYQRMHSHVKAALSGHVVTYENEITLKDGNFCSVNVTYIPHIDEQKTVKGFFSLTSDISDRKAIERMKDEFISVVSHELRTPLTSLHSALKILATGRLGTLSTDGQQMLEIADENTVRLVRLVNNVLDLQRIESGEVTMEKQACNAADLITQAAEAMQPMAQQHGVSLVTQPANIQIWVDSDYIVQALTNLLSNAIKFSLPGTTVGLTVELGTREQGAGEVGGETTNTHCQFPILLLSKTLRERLRSVQAPNSQFPISHSQPIEVLFCVRDQGQGIPQGKLESIFEKFQQVDSTDSRKKGGTGLGLTICRKIIEQHGGRIWAESTLGKGSTFYFTLPTFKQ